MPTYPQVVFGPRRNPVAESVSHVHDISGVNGLAAALAHRGALVTKAADQTAASYLTATAIAFDAEGYDTDGIHDNATNNSRLTVPAGVTKVRLLGNVYTSNVNASEDIFIDTRKNGVQSVIGMANNMTRSTIGFARTNVASAVLSVTPGDYFQLFLGTSADLSITVHKDLTWFAMEIVE